MSMNSFSSCKYSSLSSTLSLTDLAPGNDEIYEETQETFLTAGNPQDGQVVLYKVGLHNLISGLQVYISLE